MSVNTVEQALARARSALAKPTTYWLGAGGFASAGTPIPESPGTYMSQGDLQAALDSLKPAKPEVWAKYQAGLAQSGLTLAQVPRLTCDCSGFVTWALGIPRKSGLFPRDGWVNTDTIHDDAQGPQKLFARLPQAEVGALLVYPKDPRRKDHVGHIGIVTAIEAGRARVIHCAPENILIEPGPGEQRNAIAETDRSHFDEEPATIAVWFKPLPR